MNSRTSSPRAFEDTLARGLIRTGAAGRRIILAVSGGSDSMALLSGCAALSRRLSLTLHVVTVDHGLRPEARAEAEQVVARAKALGVPADPVALAMDPGPGAPERARALRYQALEAHRARLGFELVATAHTANDQAETLLMRLGRGASLRGAGAIREAKDRLIRPMLGLTRDDVLAYLKAQGQGWVEDPSNADPAYLRSRVRAELLPLFEALMGEGAIERLAHFARLAEEDDAHLFSLATAGFDALAPLRRDAVLALPPPLRRRLLARWLEAQGLALDGGLIDDVGQAVEEGRRATLPKDRILEVRAGLLCVAEAPPRSGEGGGA